MTPSPAKLAIDVRRGDCCSRPQAASGDSSPYLPLILCRYYLDPQLVTLMVGIGIPLSLLTLFAWRQVLNVVA